MQRALDLDVARAVRLEPRAPLRIVPPGERAVHGARPRHAQHQAMAGHVLLHRQAERLGGVLERARQGHGGGARRGAIPLLEPGLRPAVARGQDVLPDRALEAGVMRAEHVPGAYVIDQLGRRFVARAPGRDRPVALRPAGTPEIGVRVLGVQRRAGRLDRDRAPGLDIEMKDRVGLGPTLIGPRRHHAASGSSSSTSSPSLSKPGSRSVGSSSSASNSSSARRRPSSRGPSPSFWTLPSRKLTPLLPCVS